MGWEKNATGRVQRVQGFPIHGGKKLEWDHWVLLVSHSPWVNLGVDDGGKILEEIQEGNEGKR